MTWEGDIQVCNAFNEHFASVGRRINEAFGESEIQYTSRETVTNSIYLSGVTELEVSSMILSMKNKKCDISVYPNSIFKSIHIIEAPIIAHIIGVSFREGAFPQSLKSARVVPIF